MLSSEKISCRGRKRGSQFGSLFCDVDFPNGKTIRVSFVKIPKALIAVQVAPTLGPQREYSYNCFRRNVILH
jgi:hypothetical protein